MKLEFKKKLFKHSIKVKYKKSLKFFVRITHKTEKQQQHHQHDSRKK